VKSERLAQIPQILGAVLFGSCARGDSDEHSDVDMFVLCEDLPFAEISDIRYKVADALGIEESGISVYPLSSALEMARGGSAFVWHLKLEGKIVFSRNQEIENLLNSFERYGRCVEDLKLYRSLLRDVEESFTCSGKPNGFDLALLFTICRNTCMRISFLLGKPRFGRKGPFEVAVSHFGRKFPLSKSVYENLLAWKLWYERGVGQPARGPTAEAFAEILMQVATLVELGTELCQCRSC